MYMYKDYKLPLLVSGIFFSLFALLHLLRLAFGWGMIIGTFAVPMWVSVIALIIAVLLAIWLFKASCCCDQCEIDDDVPPKDRL